MAQRLPTPGSDDGTWGDVLNGFLEVSLATDGTLNSNTVGTAQLKDGSVTTTKLSTAGTASSSNFLRGDGTWAVPSGGGGIASVTATDSTVVIGGTGTAPTIGVGTIPESKVTNLTTDLAAKANTSSLATVATSGSYTDLNNKPTLPTVTGTNTGDQTLSFSSNTLTISGSNGNSVTLPSGGTVQTLSATSGAVMDTNAYCSPGSHNVSSTAGLYTQGLVGKTAVFIQGGSGGTTDVVTTVQSVTDSNHLVLAAAIPGGTGNPQTLIIGTDISTALATAFSNAASANATLYIPAGTYLKTSATTVPSNVTIYGSGRQETTIIHASSTTSAFTGTDLTSVIFSDWTVLGPGQGVGSGSGVNFILSANPATYYPTFVRFSASKFGVDGIAISTPIVGRFDQVVPENNGRHGFNLAGAGQADGTSCSLTACFPAGNWGAGYYLRQMAYSSLNGCAADANGVGYLYDTCIGITENGCGSEETYNFQLLGRTSFTPNGLSRYVSNSKVAMNSPFMIQNVGTACYITNAAKVTINDLYEGSPGNTDDTNSNPTASLKVDSGASVVVNNYSVVTAMSLATGTTVLLPDALQTTATASQQATVASDQSLTASSSNTVLSLTLTAGKWLVTGTVTLQQGASAGNTDIRILAGTATISGGTATTIRAASASQPAAGALTALISVTTAGTVLLNAYPVAATTVKASTTANSIPNATSLQAVPLQA